MRAVPTKRTGMMHKGFVTQISERSKPSVDGRKERSRAEKVPWQTALPMRTPKRPETLNVYWPEIRIIFCWFDHTSTSNAKNYYDSDDAQNLYSKIWGEDTLHIGRYDLINETAAPSSSIQRVAKAQELHELEFVKLIQAKTQNHTGTTDVAPLRVVDMGCGYGGMLRRLHKESLVWRKKNRSSLLRRWNPSTSASTFPKWEPSRITKRPWRSVDCTTLATTDLHSANIATHYGSVLEVLQEKGPEFETASEFQATMEEGLTVWKTKSPGNIVWGLVAAKRPKEFES
jgi:hypothetical protein